MRVNWFSSLKLSSLSGCTEILNLRYLLKLTVKCWFLLLCVVIEGVN